ncbi:MAG: DUF6561 domain-containing protein, partial [Candidatus Nanopelagicaceae bacterium]
CSYGNTRSSMIKLLRFDGHWLVAEIEEIPDVEFGDPDCVLKYPCQVTSEGVCTFPPFSRDRELVVRSSDITLIADPDDKTSARYYDLKPKETE